MIHLSFTPNNYFVTITIMIKQFKMKYAQVVISDVNDSPPVLVEVSTNHLFLFLTRELFLYPLSASLSSSSWPSWSPKVPSSCTTITEFQPASDTILTVRAVDADDPRTPNGQVCTFRYDSTALLFSFLLLIQIQSSLYQYQSLMGQKMPCQWIVTTYRWRDSFECCCDATPIGPDVASYFSSRPSFPIAQPSIRSIFQSFCYVWLIQPIHFRWVSPLPPVTSPVSSCCRSQINAL